MINIISKRYWFFLLSAIIIIPGIVSLAVYGLKLGIDFKSGTSLTLNFSPSVDEGKLRQELATLGYNDAVVQHAATGDYLIRLEQINNDEKQVLTTGLGTAFNSTVTVRDFASTPPTLTGETARSAGIAIGLAALGILLYITYAFRRMPNPFRWGTCAVIALLHDILVVLGIFSILGRFAGVEVDSLFITAMLTVAGYSVHDTIVVFDRIRENMIKGGGSGDFAEVVNYSTVQTLVRSLNTSLTVFFVLLALFLLGGTTIHYFVLVLLIGVVTGTYSSICNASALLVVWKNGEWGRFIGRKPAAVVPARQ